MPPSVCPADEELTGLLGAGESFEHRERLEFHLSECSRCRRRLMALREQLEEVKPLRAPWWLKAWAKTFAGGRTAAFPYRVFRYQKEFLGALAALAIVAIGLTLYLASSNSGKQPASPETLRQVEQNVVAPRLLAPSVESPADPARMEFRWSKVNGASIYLLTVLDQKGDVLFQSTVDDNRFVLTGRRPGLEAGKSCFWYVRAKYPDGSTVDSEIGKFSIGNK